MTVTYLWKDPVSTIFTSRISHIGYHSNHSNHSYHDYYGNYALVTIVTTYLWEDPVVSIHHLHQQDLTYWLIVYQVDDSGGFGLAESG